jgi:hypothetical protein
MTTEPIPEGRVPITPEQIDRMAAIIREVDGNHDKGAAALAEAILCHPALKTMMPMFIVAHDVSISARPIPASIAERLPGADDLDPTFGRCWWYFPERLGMFSYWQLEEDGTESEPDYTPTHWLPYHALPVPTND